MSSSLGCSGAIAPAWDLRNLTHSDYWLSGGRN